MPTVAYIKIPAANENLLEAINTGSDSWAIALASSAPAGKTFTAGTTDLATNDLVLILADPATWTATGGGFTFRYALLVNLTNNIIPGYWDYGSAQVVAAGEQVVVDLDGVNGVFKVT